MIIYKIETWLFLDKHLLLSGLELFIYLEYTHSNLCHRLKHRYLNNNILKVVGWFLVNKSEEDLNLEVDRNNLLLNT